MIKNCGRIKIRDDLLHKYQIQIAKLKGEVKAKNEILTPLYERLLLPQTQINQIIHSESKMFEQEKLLILKVIYQECPTDNIKISDNLEMDLDLVNTVLKQLKKSEFIKLIKHKYYVDPDEDKIDIYFVTEITSEGRLALKGNIPVNTDIQSNSVITINNSNVGIAHMSGGEIKDNVKITGIIKETNQTECAQLLQDIQTLLVQQEEIYNPNTKQGQEMIAKETINTINNKPNLVMRIMNASEKGLIAYLQARLINPTASFFVAALKDWQENKQ